MKITSLLLALFAPMAYSTTVTGLTHVTINPAGATPCPVTSGPLTVPAFTPRGTGISPFLVFFDATGTTDTALTGNTTAFQDVTYTWDFGDAGASGTSKWANGSNPGVNSRNVATGGVAAHLYQTAGVDTSYTATVTATDGTNTASCRVAVTAFDPSGSNGFAGTKTTCVSSSGTPVSGSGGCPTGAAVLNTSSFVTALGSSQSGKRILFKCGDTFTGDNATIAGTTFSIGAYGGCEGTQTNRPIMSDTGSTGQFTIPAAPADGRIADLDFEGNGMGAYAVRSLSGTSGGPMTLYNLNSSGNNTSYYWAVGTQWGIVGSSMTGMGTAIGVFVNYAENNCVNASAAFNCGGTPSYVNINYQAVLGNSFNGQGVASGSGIETLRLSACRMCAIENNTIQNASNIGAVLKLHNGNTFNSLPTWIGQYTELLEVSDNLFAGSSGGQLVEITPENAQDDERIRNVVTERNFFSGTTGALGGRQILASGVNLTLRDNIFYVAPSDAIPPLYGIQVAKRGIEPVPSGVEVYNNTFYSAATTSGEAAIGFDGVNFASPPINSFAINNLFFVAASGHSTVINNGTGNSVSNNTTSPNSNPSFTNGSGSFMRIPDFKPTANFSGGASVPVLLDALGVAWAPTWDLGAVHH